MDSRDHARAGHPDVRNRMLGSLPRYIDRSFATHRYTDEEQYVGQWLGDQESGLGM